MFKTYEKNYSILGACVLQIITVQVIYFLFKGEKIFKTILLKLRAWKMSEVTS